MGGVKVSRELDVRIETGTRLTRVAICIWRSNWQTKSEVGLSENTYLLICYRVRRADDDNIHHSTDEFT
jgi:hypothetical protein